MSQINGASYERTQRIYAKIAGFLLLGVILLAFGGSFLSSQVAGSGNFAERASRIAASEHLYRAGLSAVVSAFVCGVLLYFALYVTLKPVNNLLAQLAMIFSLLDSVLGCVVQMCSFVRLHLYIPPLTPGGGTVTAQALSDLMRNVAAATENIGGIMFGIGSLLFFCVFFKSGYIPRFLAGFGVLAFVIWVALYFSSLILPERRQLFQYICFVPSGIAEITTGFWLILAPLRTAALRASQ